MLKVREPFVVTRTARIILGVTLVLGLGAAVAASPIRSIPKPALTKSVATETAFKALGDGPAITVQKSFGRSDEDCVTVTLVKGPDGRVYVSRGMVCR